MCCNIVASARRSSYYDRAARHVGNPAIFLLSDCNDVHGRGPQQCFRFVDVLVHYAVVLVDLLHCSLRSDGALHIY